MAEPYKPKSEAGKRILNSLNENLADIDLPDNVIKQTEPQKSYVQLADEIAEGLNTDAS